jgi:hypothetical protein
LEVSANVSDNTVCRIDGGGDDDDDDDDFFVAEKIGCVISS